MTAHIATCCPPTDPPTVHPGPKEACPLGCITDPDPVADVTIPVSGLLTPAELTKAVVALLAITEHEPDCWPDTGCHCLVGEVEHALPRCEAIDTTAPRTMDGVELACVRIRHDDPHHLFGRKVTPTDKLREDVRKAAGVPRYMTIGAPTRAERRAALTAVENVAEAVAGVDDQLRELLSYCRSSAEELTENPAVSAYEDIADRLAGILDGED